MNIITASTCQPFGETEVEEGSEHYLYTRKEKDPTELYYYGARYYDPETERFITRDLIAGRKLNSQTLNLYTYCLNNPVNFIDPAGLDIMCINEGNLHVCIEFTANGWIAIGYYNGNTKGVPITNSKEITELMNSTDPADQARAAFLMLLISHPSIQGDRDINGNLLPGNLNKQMSNISNTMTWFDYHVKVDGEERTIHIGIDSRYDFIGKKEDIYYGEFIEAKFGDSVDLENKLYQGAFSSMSMLFHVMGHEGVHLLDCIAGREPFEKTAYAWNFNYSTLFIFPYEFKIPMVI